MLRGIALVALLRSIVSCHGMLLFLSVGGAADVVICAVLLSAAGAALCVYATGPSSVCASYVLMLSSYAAVRLSMLSGCMLIPSLLYRC